MVIKESMDKAEKLWVKTEIASVQLPPEGFILVSGKTLKHIDIAFEKYGQLNAARSNGIFICSPLTTDAHAAGWNSEEDRKPGWWDEMIGPGKAIDTNRYCVISSNVLGGCKGTTGPSSINSTTGLAYGSDFPKITVEDIVNVQRLLTLYLGIDVLEAVVGGSLGGMQALQWTASYPNKVRKCICIAAAACLSAQGLGFEIIGRKVIVNDPHFHKGDYYSQTEKPDSGLSYARMIGHLTYLSAMSMHEKFGRQHKLGYNEANFETGFEVESYLNYQGDQFVKRFDANSYLHITYAMDNFDLVARYGSLQQAFGASQAEYVLVGLSSDWLFFPEQTRELGKVLLELKKVVSVIELDSPYGHDAFLLEVNHLSKVIESFLLKSHVDSTGESALSSKAEDAPFFKSENDFAVMREWVEEGSHIVDVGCGDGALIDSLYRSNKVTGVGIDIDLNHVVDCLRKEVPVLHFDVDLGLSLIADNAFDYAVLNRTLPVVKKPQLVLREMLRVARKGIVSFPNFANIHNRLAVGFRGIMPVSENLPITWYETPNIHLFTLKDFQELCALEGIVIEQILCLGETSLSRWCLRFGMENLGADFVVAKISRPA